MGFFKKIFKGVGKVFKKIGRGIKKTVGKIGKFMNKIGIVGQIAMAFILPGIGNALMNGIGGIASSMVTNTLGGIGGAIVKGAGHVVSAAHKFVTVGKNAFNTVTEGVTKFIGEFSKTALNKIPGVNIKSASTNFFGKGGAWETVQQDVVKNAGNIVNPFRSTVDIKQGMDLKEVMNSTGVSRERIQEMNLGLDLDDLKVGDKINFDANSLGSTLAGQGPLKMENMSFKQNIGTKAPTMKVEDIFTPEQIQNQENLKALGISPEQLRQQFEPTKSLLNPQANVVPDTTFGSNIIEGVKKEVTDRYGNFSDKPISTSLTALQDLGTASQISQVIDPQVPEDIYGGGSDYSPMYVGAGVSDMEVSAIPTGNRNFSAYANMGQYGSTSRIYDTILMNPVSTWSRDLSSRFS